MSTLLLVILAKSYKLGGRCIAGRLCTYTDEKKVNIGKWVRPVANDGTGCGSLTKEMYSYEGGGGEVKILDIVEIPIVEACPVAGQPENYIIDESRSWKKIGHLTPTCINNIAEDIDTIWLDANTISSEVTPSYDQSGLVSQSLCLIKPENLVVKLAFEYNSYENQYKRKITASFDYKNVRYENLSITCPATRKILTNQYPSEGEPSKDLTLNKGDDYILCISLGPRFGNNSNHYKFVATIFDFDGYLQDRYSS